MPKIVNLMSQAKLLKFCLLQAQSTGYDKKLLLNTFGQCLQNAKGLTFLNTDHKKPQVLDTYLLQNEKAIQNSIVLQDAPITCVIKFSYCHYYCEYAYNFDDAISELFCEILRNTHLVSHSMK